jgi:hypothetical protein
MIAIRAAAMGLIAGTVPVVSQAQEITSSPPEAPTAIMPDRSSQDDVSEAGPTEPPAVPATETAPFEFRDAEGNPLPPELQKKLLEQLNSQSSTNPERGSQADTGETPSPSAIVVTAERPRGSVASDIPPERTFRQLDIKALGVNDIQELLDTIEPQVRSERGRDDNGPVVLLNGRRISSLAEIAQIPAEAIERMEVFPEDVALAYGYAANTKVVNVVLLARYNSAVGLASYLVPTEGGFDTYSASASYLRISGDTRTNLDTQYSRSGNLTEFERNIVQPSASTDPGRFRTLLPQSERVALNATVSRVLVGNLSSTLNASFETSSSESLFGLNAQGPVIGETERSVAHIGTTVAGQSGRWQWVLAGNYDRTETDTEIGIDQLSSTRSQARSINELADANLVVSGNLLDMPAGPLSSTVRAGFDLRNLESRSVFAGEAQNFDISRDRIGAQVSFSLPLVSRAGEADTPLGDVSVNLNAGLDNLSDFGSLLTVGYGLAWSPSPQVNLIASMTHMESAPTVEQLGAPSIVTPNVRVYDFARQVTSDVVRTFGGNPGLLSDDLSEFSLTFNAKPFAGIDLTLSGEYLNSRIDDPIAAFPIITPQVESAFPERITRSADGTLIAIDARPVNFVRRDRQQVRLGLNYSRPLGQVPEELRDIRVRVVQSESDVQRRVPAGATLSRVAPGSADARLVDNLTSRFYIDFYYTLQIEDAVVLREGSSALDLLDGDAIDPRGARSRHEIEVQVGASKRGLGARMSATWRSATAIVGIGDRDDDLRFSDYGTINLSLFANLADRFGGPDAPDWLKGTRISVGVTNILNERPDVRDRLGVTPLNYQSPYFEPIGRSVSIAIRKVF